MADVDFDALDAFVLDVDGVVRGYDDLIATLRGRRDDVLRALGGFGGRVENAAGEPERLVMWWFPKVEG